MATITLRATKGSPLTNTEVDNNFSNLNTDISTRLLASGYNAADILSKLATVDGTGSGLDADLLDGLNTATAATANTVVIRDGSGGFSAGTIAATNFSGTHTGVASLTSGSVTGITDITVADGGTGSSTASGARTNLGVAIGSDVQAYSANLGAIAATTSAADTLPYFNGASTATTATLTGTGRTIIASTSLLNARSNLGVAIGTDVQAFSANLSADAGVTSGIMSRTGSGTTAGRTITAGAGISVTNGDGVAGNPTVAANVTSVQGNTGAVIVSVPVTSVQGNTGAVIVTQNFAYGSLQGAPTALSQFSNNLGNYGAFITGAAGSVSAATIQSGINCNNCGDRQCNNCGNMNNSKQGLDANLIFNNCGARQGNCNCNC